MSNIQAKSKRQFIPAKVKKELQNLKSWRALYTYLGTPNPEGIKVVDQQIQDLKDANNIKD